MTLAWLPDYVAVDIETSGLAAQVDDLLEIAGVKFVAGLPVDRFTTTLQNANTLGQRTARMTGLTDSALAEGLPAAEALRALDKFAGSLPLVAHNVSLDREFLTRFAADLDEVHFTDNQWWDSLELAALVFPELDSLALEHVANALKLEIGTLHRAEADAELAGHVFAQLFAHVASAWPAYLTERIRTTYLAQHPFGIIMQGLELGDTTPPPTAALARLVPGALPAITGSGGGANTAHLRRSMEEPALIASLAEASTEMPQRLVYPPAVYPGTFHGVEKDLRSACDDANIPCYAGRQSLLHPDKLDLVLAGGIAIPGGLSDFEKALLLAWGHTSDTGDFTRLSWWVLNNYPTLATALECLNAISLSSLPTDDPRAADPAAAVRDSGAGALSWDVTTAGHAPLTPDPELHAALAEIPAQWMILRPEYWPLHALRGLQVTLSVTALTHELTWLAAQLVGDAPAELAAWWAAHGAGLQAKATELEAQLQQFGDSTQHPLCAIRGADAYWPLVEEIGDGSHPDQVSGALAGLAGAFGTAIPAALEVTTNEATPTVALRQIYTALKRLDAQRLALQWMSETVNATHIICRHQAGKDDYWWSLESFPLIPREITKLLPAKASVQLHSTFLDEDDWRLVEQVWSAQPMALSFTDETPAIPAGNTVHLPLMPPGVRNLPAKKVWQNWQLAILRRLMQSESGRLLIVARNPQDVATLQYRLRDPMLKSGWQPLFQRHDGTKGFLMREFGSFEKVVMVGTGEILQELNRFSATPDALAILHVPTRPPNDLACVVMQQQMQLSPDQFRDQVIFPLGVLDLKRALLHWEPFRQGTARAYLLDYRQLDQPELRGLINQSFPNQNLIDTQPAGRY